MGLITFSGLSLWVSRLGLLLSLFFTSQYVSQLGNFKTNFDTKDIVTKGQGPEREKKNDGLVYETTQSLVA